MCGCRILIALTFLVICCSPTLADTLNSFGKAHGLPALHRSGTLQAMTQRHANNMASHRSMDHDAGFTPNAGLAARGLKISRTGARAKAAQCACGKIREDTVPICCWPTSKVMALHRRVTVATAIGV